QDRAITGTRANREARTPASPSPAWYRGPDGSVHTAPIAPIAPHSTHSTNGTDRRQRRHRGRASRPRLGGDTVAPKTHDETGDKRGPTGRTIHDLPEVTDETLTPRQQRVLAVIRWWVDRYGYPPSVRE